MYEKLMMRYIILFLLFFGTNYCCFGQASEPVAVYGQKGLKDYYQHYFPIGVAIPVNALNGDERDFILQQFNSLTPENAMKMEAIHPKENEYRWKDADAIAAFARQHQLKLRGHNLCWHSQAPGWMFRDANGKTVSKEVLLQRLKDHITTVVSRYRGTVYAWDVVNEAISDKKEEFYRDSPWYQICGEEYIAKAFQWAHEADPDAVLFYNDYGEIDSIKRSKIIKLVKDLKARNIPVEAVGLQSHWSVNAPSREQLQKTLTDFSKSGLKMQITELDVSVYSGGHTKTDEKQDTSFTAEEEQRQLETYKMCFELFRQFRKNITGVTFWNISDRHSWLDNFPVHGRKNYPLLFNKDLAPKKAFWEVVNF